MKILVVGSKEYEGQSEALIRAAEELGRAIVKAGHTLIVVSDREDAVDQYVVAGAVTAKLKHNQIEIHRSAKDESTRLTGGGDESARFIAVRQYHEATDPSVIHFHAMEAAEAVILIGGGRGTITAGLCAHLMNKPVLPIGAFGGGAATVWHAFSMNRQRFYFGGLTDAEIDDLSVSKWRGDDAGPDRASAPVVVRSVEKVLRAARLRSMSLRLLVVTLVTMVFSLVGWIGLLMWPFIYAELRTPTAGPDTKEIATISFFWLFGVVLFTGTLGASVKLLRQMRNGEDVTERTLMIDTILGSVAGVIAAVMYLLAEAAITGRVEARKMPDDFLRVGLVLSLVAMFAGLYLDAAFERFDSLKSNVLSGRFKADEP